MSDPTRVKKLTGAPLSEIRDSGPVDLDRVSAESDPSNFFEIRVAHRPVPVRIEYAAIRELHRQLAGEGESVGLLLGSSTPDALSIQRCEVLAVSPSPAGDPKLLLGAFRQSLEARSQSSVANAPQTAGCFRTQVAGWPGMKETDLGMVKRTSPGSDSLFILIRTTRHRPWLASLYVLDAKTTTTAIEPALEFPFDEYLLRNGYLTDLVETSERIDVQEQPKNTKTLWIVAGLLLAILVAGSAAAYRFKWFRSSDQTDAVGRNTPTPVLNLKVNRSGKDFEVSWDRLSTAVQQATGGMLTITDGALTRPVALNGSQLREGRILYTPLFEELTFRLEVITRDSGTAAESVQVLAWSGKQPADVLSVASPDPLANTPARVVAVPASPLPASPKAPVPAAKSAPAAAVKPPPGKQTQPAKTPSVPETVAVIQPSPANSAPAAPARVPETPAPAVTPERPAAAQASPTPPPSPAPPKADIPSATQAAPAATVPASLPPPTVAPTIASSASPAPVSATPTISSKIVAPVPIQRVAATIPRNIPAGMAAGVPRVISVRVMVDSAGSVQSAEVTASSPKGAFGEALLKAAALDAAKMWKFRPGQVNGKNVAAEYGIDFKF